MAELRRTSRREFLQGKAAVHALGDVATRALDSLSPAPNDADVPAPAAQAESYLVRLARRAMACQFEFFLNAGQYPSGTEAVLAALDLVDQLEGQLTVYRDDSEVSRINRNASAAPVAVEPRLFELLEEAVDLFRQTRGAFDITAGPLSRVWGFMRRNGAIPAAADLAAARALVGSQRLLLDRSERTIRFSIPGMEINLGAIGKGYALDRCAELVLAAGIGDFLLHGGHSSVLARGSQGLQAAAAGWVVGVRNPLRPEQRLGELRVRDRALATSGSGTQYFEHQGRRYGHILDPQSGWPAEGVLSATVLAPTAAQADALSTAFYVWGPSPAADYCREHPEIASVLTYPGKRAGAVEIHALNFEKEDWKVL